MLALWVELNSKKNIKYLIIILKLCTASWNAVNKYEFIGINWTSLIYIHWRADPAFHIYLILLGYINGSDYPERKKL